MAGNSFRLPALDFEKEHEYDWNEKSHIMEGDKSQVPTIRELDNITLDVEASTPVDAHPPAAKPQQKGWLFYGCIATLFVVTFVIAVDGVIIAVSLPVGSRLPTILVGDTD